jgi:glycosyltransferase involved in cell wall biosynthesis
VVVFPRDRNPYQELLHAELSVEGVNAGYLSMPTPSKTLNLLLMPAGLLRARLRGVRIWHLHWVFDFVLPGSGRFPVLRRVMQAWFTLVLAWSRLIGLRLVWTAHNVLPHDRVFWDDPRARRTLLRRADAVLVHDPQVTPRLQHLMGGEPLPPVTVVPHGPYSTWYRAEGTREQARTRLGLPLDRTILLFFGAVTLDKGVADLVAAYARICRAATTTSSLVIAGHCADPGLEAEIRSVARAFPEQLRPRLEYVPDEQVGAYLTAADALTLPFRSATTRGSVVLARSFAKTMVLPDLPALREVPEDACLRYHPDDPGGLEAALVRACSMSAADLRAIGGKSRLREDASWPEAARVTAATYRVLLGQARRPFPVEAT